MIINVNVVEYQSQITSYEIGLSRDTHTVKTLRKNYAPRWFLKPKRLYQTSRRGPSAGSLIYLVGTRCFSSSLQFNTTVKGTDALGPTGITRRNRLPSAVTSPTTTPGGA